MASLARSITFRMLGLPFECVENEVAVFVDETGDCINEFEPTGLIELETLASAFAVTKDDVLPIKFLD